ncbi:hypothetical protein [Anaeromassilibacillus sp. SJQ-1]|uniref:hypothetical protein n=1 Tax=Anaeromassilibacillus sp. SJQ-1 TaxID=3375419 RepID=UPI0039892116
MEEAAVAKDGEASVLANDILHNRENIARIEREIAQSDQSGKDMEEEIARKSAEIAEKTAFIEAKEAESAACMKRLEEIRKGMGETAAKNRRLFPTDSCIVRRIDTTKVGFHDSCVDHCGDSAADANRRPNACGKARTCRGVRAK